MIDSTRLQVLRNLISNQRIVSQQQLIILLKDRGFDVTQSTLSRDLKAIHALKVQDDDGTKTYVLQQTDRYLRIPHSAPMRKEEMHWYVMIVRALHEKKTAEILTARGIENWVPVQIVRRRWSDRIKIVETLVISKIVFIHCTETQRLKDSIIPDKTMSFLMDRMLHLPATIPDEQIQTFRMMIANSEQPVEFTEELLQPGQIVEIMCGKLIGQTAEICRVKGKSVVTLRLEGLGSAITQIPISDVKPLKAK